MNDNDYVNFSEDYELSYHLNKVNKRQSEKNRDTLKIMGDELKLELNTSRLTHKQFSPYVEKQKYRLE
jgi:hypothetical protein